MRHLNKWLIFISTLAFLSPLFSQVQQSYITLGFANDTVQLGKQNQVATTAFLSSTLTRGHAQTASTLMIGTGVLYRLQPKWQLDLGVNWYKLGDYQVKGDIYDPGMMGDPSFRSHYRVSSLAVLAKAGLRYRLARYWYLSGAILLGFADTLASDYRATATPGNYGETAIVYSNRAHFDFAQGAQIGTLWAFKKDWQLGLQYRFLFLGSTDLGGGESAGPGGDLFYAPLKGQSLQPHGVSLQLNYSF